MRWFIRFPWSTPKVEERVPIWSVSERIARTFFRVAGVLWVVAFSFIVYKRWVARSQDPPAGRFGLPAWRVAGDFMLGVLTDFGAVGISIAIFAMVFTGTVHLLGDTLMTLNQYLVNRFVLPLIEAHKAEGRAENQAEWVAWNERRLDAEREGRDFAEPPPELTAAGEASGH